MWMLYLDHVDYNVVDPRRLSSNRRLKTRIITTKSPMLKVRLFNVMAISMLLSLCHMLHIDLLTLLLCLL